MQLQRLLSICIVINAYLNKERCFRLASQSHFQQNEVMFIGHNLDESLIKRQLNNCLAELVVKNKFNLPSLPW